jgi:hypothetical protein
VSGRDGKNRRHGWALRNTQLTKADRVDRLLLILCLADILLVGIGLLAKQNYGPKAWCSSTDPDACSVFFIGRKMRLRLQVSAREALAAVIAALGEASHKWG